MIFLDLQLGPYHVLLPADGNGIELLLQQVPDAKAGKNRMHFDLRVLDLDAEVTRLLALGARQVTNEPLANNGWVWHVLRDPDGNEFCVLRPPDENRDGLTELGSVNDPVNDSSLTKETLP